MGRIRTDVQGGAEGSDCSEEGVHGHCEDEDE
jgi:hypothetical protein